MASWAEVEVLEDLTGGFNYGSGTVEVQCPPTSGVEPIAGRRLHWLRCRIAETTRISGEPAVYTQPPEIYQITAAPIGRAARRPSTPTCEIDGARSAPATAPPARRSRPASRRCWRSRPRRRSRSETPRRRLGALGRARLVCRHRPPTTATSRSTCVHGQIQLGPAAARRRTAPSRMHGAIPPKGAALRHVAATATAAAATATSRPDTLTTLRSAIPGVASVTQPAAGAWRRRPAVARVGPRARRRCEIRTRYRAVTAEDYEFLATEATPRVARALRRRGRPSRASRSASCRASTRPTAG